MDECRLWISINRTRTRRGTLTHRSLAAMDDVEPIGQLYLKDIQTRPRPQRAHHRKRGGPVVLVFCRRRDVIERTERAHPSQAVSEKRTAPGQERASPPFIYIS